MSKKRKEKVFLNYDIEFRDPHKRIATLVKWTKNPEYSFEMDFELLLFGDIFFIKAVPNENKIAASKNLFSYDERYVSPAGFCKFLAEVMCIDATCSMSYAVMKAVKAKGLDRGKSWKKRISNSRLKRKSYHFIDKICKESPLWKNAFTSKNKVLTSFISILSGGRYDEIIYSKTMVEKTSLKLMKKLKDSYFFRDYDNIYCFRKYLDTIFSFKSGIGSISLGLEFKLDRIFEGWENILGTKESNSKRRTIGTWPNILSGIMSLPQAKFNRHVKDKLEIKSHLAFAEIFLEKRKIFRERGGQWVSNKLDLISKIQKTVQKCSNKEIRRAYRIFKLHRRMEGMVSFSRLKEMYTHIDDSLEIYVQGNCDDNFRVEFYQGIMNCKSLKRIVELCNLMHRDQIVVENRNGNKGKLEHVAFNYPTINPNFKKDGAIVKYIDYSDDVYLEGKQMHHCVGTYTRDASVMYKLLFHISYKGEDATLSLCKNTDGLYDLQQCFGPYNRNNAASKKARKLLEEWTNRYNAWIRRTPQYLKKKEIGLLGIEYEDIEEDPFANDLDRILNII